MWKDYPANPWGTNKGNMCDANGTFVLYTLRDFNKTLDMTDDGAVIIINNRYDVTYFSKKR